MAQSLQRQLMADSLPTVDYHGKAYKIQDLAAQLDAQPLARQVQYQGKTAYQAIADCEFTVTRPTQTPTDCQSSLRPRLAAPTTKHRASTRITTLSRSTQWTTNEKNRPIPPSDLLEGLWLFLTLMDTLEPYPIEQLLEFRQGVKAFWAGG